MSKQHILHIVHWWLVGSGYIFYVEIYLTVYVEVYHILSASTHIMSEDIAPLKIVILILKCFCQKTFEFK